MLLRAIDLMDLTWLHTSGTIVGMVFSIYAAQAMWHDSESQRDCRLIRYGRKLAYPGLALALLWALDYSHNKGWAPWPPYVAIIWGINLIIGLRILALRARQIAIAQRGWFRPDGIDRHSGL